MIPPRCDGQTNAIDSYLAKHIVVPADIDGSRVIMSLTTYESKARLHRYTPVYRRVEGSAEEREHKAQRWIIHVHTLDNNIVPKKNCQDVV